MLHARPDTSTASLDSNIHEIPEKRTYEGK
jgi:hypothetical protein